jgi:hypothetical protein
MCTTQAALLVVGAAFEFAGIVLVGSPDLFPQAVRVSGWLRLRHRTIVNRLWRLIGRPRAKVVEIGLASEINVAASLSAIKSTSDIGSLEDKVGFLLRRDQEAQRDMNALRERVDAIERDSPKRLDELRDSMETHVAGELRAALEVYLPLRVAGAFALAAGLICVMVANFVD